MDADSFEALEFLGEEPAFLFPRSCGSLSPSFPLLFLGAALVGWFGGGWMSGSLGRRRRGMVEDIDDGGRHGFVGVCQEQAYLPHFGTAELSLEGGHTREADAILDFPVG